MNRPELGTHQKALQINLDSATYGTFAEIGAGQEVARWFFRVGGAAGTIAKSMSAYDMVVSDAIYGPAERYVSRQRLRTMLDYEFGLLRERLEEPRGSTTRFFVFADTVTARSYTRKNDEAHGWMGIRFQVEPRCEPSQIIMHVRMLDEENVQQQEALGVIGVNLVYGALYHAQQPQTLIASLLDNLTSHRVEVDLIKFSGPAFASVDNRLMGLQLVAQGLTNAVLFTADGEVMQASEMLYKRSILVERGSFSPITNLSIDMIDCAQRQFTRQTGVRGQDFVALAEMTLNSLSDGGALDHQGFLDRADMLGALGKTVLVSDYGAYFRLAGYLFRHTKQAIGLVLGVPSLRELFEEKYYTDLEGGILESIGRLFKNDLRLYVYPFLDPQSGTLITADSLHVAPKEQHLYRYLLENHHIVPIVDYDPRCLPIMARDVIDKIRAGDPSWKDLVPVEVGRLIEARRLFGCSSALGAPRGVSA